MPATFTSSSRLTCDTSLCLERQGAKRVRVHGTLPYGEVEHFQTPRFDTQPRRPTRLNAAIPEWLESILMRAVDSNPERRYQNFSEMAYAFSHPAKVAPHHQRDSPLLERNPLLFYKLLSALFLAIILVLLALLNRR